jgi:hypothetical protein
LRLAPFATVFLGAISFIAGLVLIGIGTGLWIVAYYSMGFYESLPLMALGGLLTFIAIPIALFGFDTVPRWIVGPSSLSGEGAVNDEPLFSNKRFVGLSLVLTGAIWLSFSVISLWAAFSVVVPCVACPENFNSSIFSTNYLDNWILIAIGGVILGIGLILLVLSKFETSTNQISTLERNTFAAKTNMINFWQLRPELCNAKKH